MTVRSVSKRFLRLAAFRAVRLRLTDYACSFLEAMPPRRSLQIKTVLNGKAEPYRTEGGKPQRSGLMTMLYSYDGQ